MNYLAPTNGRYQGKKQLTTWQKIMEIGEFLGHMWDLFVGLPRLILEKFGISLDFWSISSALCSMCCLCSFIAIGSSVGIGLGVGLGVGLSCKKSRGAVASTSNVTDPAALNKAAITTTVAGIATVADTAGTTVSTILANTTAFNSSTAG
ncbi:unnamed protein product [Rotaria sp. Silwood1]|nr:unnamed protein product [Rotaria sp. Silwood1]CAF1633432.1 unnamed protein product [Rotaria sp. Silwood1]CAF3721104.1 unnamed protein product [Rotaria sp. Silwood1]CAF4668940.1 unnamed protein product [Rotaria sp. Silwood1]